jgi:hypothetical protein
METVIIGTLTLLVAVGIGLVAQALQQHREQAQDRAIEAAYADFFAETDDVDLTSLLVTSEEPIQAQLLETYRLSSGKLGRPRRLADIMLRVEDSGKRLVILKAKRPRKTASAKPEATPILADNDRADDK